jgi:ribosomal protein S18 acetylase RimI-like enzyme
VTATGEAAKNIIEPFDPNKHDRAAFSCGVEQVDNYFKRTANKLNKADNVRLWVMTTPDDEVIGFYAINAHAVSYADLPKRFARIRPSHGNIPAVYISMIGRDEKFRGGGYGGDLLIDALKSIAIAADQIGISIVMLDVLNCGNPDKTAARKSLYESYGFISLEAESLRMFLPIGTVRQLLDDLT